MQLSVCRPRVLTRACVQCEDGIGSCTDPKSYVDRTNTEFAKVRALTHARAMGLTRDAGCGTRHHAGGRVW